MQQFLGQHKLCIIGTRFVDSFNHYVFCIFAFSFFGRTATSLIRGVGGANKLFRGGFWPNLVGALKVVLAERIGRHKEHVHLNGSIGFLSVCRKSCLKLPKSG